MNLVQVDVVELQALQAGVNLMEYVIARLPRPFGVSSMLPVDLVATTSCSRGNPGFATPVPAAFRLSE